MGVTCRCRGDGCGIALEKDADAWYCVVTVSASGTEYRKRYFCDRFCLRSNGVLDENQIVRDSQGNEYRTPDELEKKFGVDLKATNQRR